MRLVLLFAILFSAPLSWGAQVAPDFFVYTQSHSTRAKPVTDCRANIRTTICLVDPLPPKDGPSDPPVNRTCLPGGAKYAAPLERIYDDFPAHLQKMFCSLRRIYVEREFEGSAYAGVVKNADGVQDGALMGIRQSLLEEGQPFALSFWASWKEQLSFGGILKRYELTPGLPLIDVAMAKPPSNDFLYFVIAHEFGHIFDFANRVNQFDCPLEEDRECAALPSTWSSIAWKTNKHVEPAADFFGREHLCFYWCEGKNVLKAADADRVYSEFYPSLFISLYGATNPYDDFAETVAYLAIREAFDARYVIRTGSGLEFEMGSKLESPAFAAKAGYVRGFFERPDLKYP